MEDLKKIINDDMQIIKVDIKKIKPYPHNAKKHPKEQIKNIAQSLKDFGWKQPLVLDTFCGSGTSFIACEQLGRTCYGMELDPKYCDVIIKRWETLTGKKAVKIKE